MCFLSWTLLWSPHRIVAGVKTSLSITSQYTEGAADTDDADECFTQPHYEPQREVVFRGFFFFSPMEVLHQMSKIGWGPRMKKSKANKDRGSHHYNGCDLYILKVFVSVFPAGFLFFCFALPAPDKWTANYFKIKNLWPLYTRNDGLSSSATPGNLCSLNIISISTQWNKGFISITRGTVLENQPTKVQNASVK